MKTACLILLLGCLFSCESTKNVSVQKGISESNLLKSKEEGYFKAYDNESGWQVELSEMHIHFRNTKNGEEHIFPHVEPIRAADANVKLYTVENDENSLQLTIYHELCDMKDGEKNDYRIDILWKKKPNLKEESYRGCGTYTLDYRLYDIWVLEEMEGKSIDKNQFSNNKPSLEINSSTKKIHGFSGCNRFNGIVFQERELLRFTQIMSTKMTCEQLSFEANFIKVLQSSTGYKIKNNRLYLTNRDGIMAVFRKTD